MELHSSETAFFKGGSAMTHNNKQLRQSHKSGEKMPAQRAGQHLLPTKSISNDVDDGASTKRAVRGLNLNNNSMNSASLQNHYQSNKNSKLFAQSSISNEMMRKNVMNDILR